MEIINQVYETIDYSLFKNIKENRQITENLNLKSEIEKYGILVPVTVNEKYEIIDGQHRVYYAKALELPVPFVVQKGYGKNEIISINNSSKNWKLADFINRYAQEGISEYKKMMALIKKYDVSANLLCSLAFNTTDNTRPAAKARSGELQFVNYDFLIGFLEFYQDLIENTALANRKGTGLAAALYSLYRIDGFDEERVFDKSGQINELLRGVTQQAEITSIIIRCYNERLREGSRREIKFYRNARGGIEFFETAKPEVKDLPGSSSAIYKLK